MNVAYKWTLTAIVVFCLICSYAVAGAQDEGNVLINSDPQGALVTLKGPLELSGVTPVRFDRVLSGRYELIVQRDGFETHKAVTYFSETQDVQLDIALKRKTSTKAFFRSLILPGWGQRYYGSKTKSTAITIGLLASAIGYAVVKDDYDNKVETYNGLRRDFAAADLWSDLHRLDADVRAAQNDANDAEDKVNVMTALVVGVYAFNLLDAILFFPEHSSYTEYKAITAAPDIGNGRVGVTLSLRF